MVMETNIMNTGKQNLERNTQIKSPSNEETSNMEVVTEFKPINTENPNSILQGGSEIKNVSSMTVDADTKQKIEPNNTESNNNTEEPDEQTGGSNGTDGIDPAELKDYKIEWLATGDEELVAKGKIVQRVKEYMANYNSEEFKQYKQDYKNLYQKYSNKRHIIMQENDKIIVIKNTNKREKVYELDKPKYIFYYKDQHLYKMLRDIGNERTSLKLNYDKLTSRIDVSLEERKEFEKQRRKFIDLLERYYIFTLYHSKINNIDNTEKRGIIIQNTILVNKKNDEEEKVLNGNYYMIANSLVDEINKTNASKLDEYNTLVSRLQTVKDVSKNKEMIEQIKQYLKRDQNIELNKQITHQKKEQDNLVTFIVSKLPDTN